MSKKLVFDETSGKARHIARKDNIRRHKRFSHSQGECVEFIGNDKKKRGLGIIIAECNSNGSTFEEINDWLSKPHNNWHNKSEKEWKHEFSNEEVFTHVKVFWQNLAMEEVISKTHVRKIPDRTDGKVIIKNK